MRDVEINYALRSGRQNTIHFACSAITRASRLRRLAESAAGGQMSACEGRLEADRALRYGQVNAKPRGDFREALAGMIIQNTHLIRQPSEMCRDFTAKIIEKCGRRRPGTAVTIGTIQFGRMRLHRASSAAMVGSSVRGIQ